jgi:nucleotide-binding universal stress UspA family protein
VAAVSNLIEAVESPPIVVGVEGSEPGLAATRWAATEAALRGRALLVVHTYQPPVEGWVSDPAPRCKAEAVLAAAVDAARSEVPRVRVTGQARITPAAPTLIDLSGEADLVVVGHRGHGCGSPLQDLRSPVATTVAAHALGPVVVVRPGMPALAATSGSIVVGVDGSPAASVALGFAFEEAALRHRPLQVVLALRPAGQTTQDTAERDLSAWVRPWQDAFPQLPVTLTVAPTHPIGALTEASRHAALLVVGARGGGGFARLTIGSVSQQLVHLATCPVAVLRATRRRATRGTRAPIAVRAS